MQDARDREPGSLEGTRVASIVLRIDLPWSSGSNRSRAESRDGFDLFASQGLSQVGS